MAHILIVEDDLLMRQALCRGLAFAGHQTTVAADGLVGLEELVQEKPDLVLLDLVLRDEALNGLELLDRIRELHPELPVIIMTGYGTVTAAVEAMKRGASDFIQKPFNIDEMMAAVDRSLEMAAPRQEADLRRPPSPAATGAGGRPAIDAAAREVVAHWLEDMEPGQVFDQVMQVLLQEALRRSRGRQAEACRWLGINRSRFSYRLKQYGIDPKDYA